MSFNADHFISKTPGFPKPGITFYDISPILEDAAALRQTMDALSELVQPMRPEIIAGVDARGFLFALPLALSMECGMVMVRKAGKLPGELFEQSYALEYGEGRLSIQASRQLHSKRVVLCDDLLATGGTLEASARLVAQSGGILAGAVCIIELTGLGGRARLDCPVAALQTYEF
ncbi:MAG: adenine phosphoribosyltransferase [Pseudomonadota bacterium]|nr:adenine phosphoribosyltransferase [Pseudomonadota bacterium]